jgi:hypothetical protein
MSTDVQSIVNGDHVEDCHARRTGECQCGDSRWRDRHRIAERSSTSYCPSTPQEEILAALTKAGYVAGFSWGGTEMSEKQNGDFMHFDCRNTPFGNAVYSKTAPTKQA